MDLNTENRQEKHIRVEVCLFIFVIERMEQEGIIVNFNESFTTTKRIQKPLDPWNSLSH